MRRAFRKLLAFCFFLSSGFSPTLIVHAQSTGIQITLLDKLGQPTSSIIDGNTVSLKIEFADPPENIEQVDFLLSGVDDPIEECHLSTGGRSCETASFSALGWSWNPDGTPAPQRTLTARLNGQQVGVGLNVEVAPRPVVMVHGFNADFHTWDNYLGPQGYLATLGLEGFAVGDGQVEGVMNTGSLSDPNARTNTIAENAAILGAYIANVQAVTGAEKVDLLVEYVDHISRLDFERGRQQQSQRGRQVGAG